MPDQHITGQSDLFPELAGQSRDAQREQLYRELEDRHTPHQRRCAIGEYLAQIGDTRQGIGLRNDLPDIAWLPVAGSDGEAVPFKNDAGKTYATLAVQPFYMAQYPVTFLQFRAFTDSGEYTDLRWWDGFPKRYQPQDLHDASNDLVNAPRDKVSWYQGVAFGRWLTDKFHGLEITHPLETGEPWIIGESAVIRLPMEWEWQWAAQAGREARVFPWGDWDESPRANTAEAGLGKSTAVGLYPHGAAACGALDMTGNLWEWCLNKHKVPGEIRMDASKSRRAMRGGTFYYDQSCAYNAYRNHGDPKFNYGFLHGIRMCCGLASPI